ncbi:uncharacterized protein LOC141587696 [Silene latifolia]|uniref:uncharacterized protein LOC141587696 n=1 Tax=Silene latifolia TaxID=37657 RepID=UPI003D782063
MREIKSFTLLKFWHCFIEILGKDEGAVAVNPSKSSTGRRRKKVVAVEDEVEESDVADEGIDEEAVHLGKGKRKTVTFSLGRAKGKSKGKAMEEEDEADEHEDDIETDVEKEEEVDTGKFSVELVVLLVLIFYDDPNTLVFVPKNIDVVDGAVKVAVNAWKSALEKKAVGKPTEVTKDRPLESKALKMILWRTEVGDGAKKRKGAESSMVLAKKKKEVDGHGSPRQLFNLIGMLTESQKKDVEDIGFGGLLELKTHAFYHQMVDWLLRKYDRSSRMFLFNRHVQFVLTKHDVYDAFMLPCTDKQIEAKTDQDLAKIWRERFKLWKNDGLSFEAVRQEMLALADGGADFKRLFVVFVMGTFLAPTVHNRIDFRLVKAVEDVGGIAQLDWCSLVLLRLNAAVDSWRTHDTKNVGGCLMFLQMMYFHCLTWWGEPEKTSLPLVQHWTYERLKERMAQEVAAYPHHQGFGIGIWELQTYPVSRHEAKRLYRRPTENEPASRNTPLRFVQLPLPLPDGVPTDEELQATFYDVRVRNWMTTRRNLSVVNVIHKSLMRELGAQDEGGVELQSTWNVLGEKLDALIDVEMVHSPSFSLGVDEIGAPSQRVTHANTHSRGRKTTAQPK